MMVKKLPRFLRRIAFSAFVLREGAVEVAVDGFFVVEEPVVHGLGGGILGFQEVERAV
jgi:hypothetical protein